MKAISALLFALFAMAAAAQSPIPSPPLPTCAILGFQTCNGLSADEGTILTDRFASELDKFKVYQLVAITKTREILAEQNRAAGSTNTAKSAVTALEAGRILAVRKTIAGSIGRIGPLFTIMSQVVDVETGLVEQQVSTDITGSRIEELLTAGMKQHAASLAAAIRTAPPAEADSPRPKPTCVILDFVSHGGFAEDDLRVLHDRFGAELHQLDLFRAVNVHPSPFIAGVEAGHVLGVQKTIRGTLGKMGSLFTISTQLIDVETGRVECQAVSDISGPLENVLTAGMKENAQKLAAAYAKSNSNP